MLFKVLITKARMLHLGVLVFASKLFSSHAFTAPFLLGRKVCYIQRSGYAFTANRLHRSIDFSDVHSTFLFRNIKYGNKSAVDLELQAGFDPNCQEPDSLLTPLMVAVECNQQCIAQLLLNRGADIHLQDINGDTALLKAVQMGYKDLVVLLLNNGAKPLESNNEGKNVFDYTDNAAILNLLRKSQT